MSFYSHSLIGFPICLGFLQKRQETSCLERRPGQDSSNRGAYLSAVSPCICDLVCRSNVWTSGHHQMSRQAGHSWGKPMWICGEEGGEGPTVMLFPNKTNHRLDKLWHLLTLMRWGFCWIHALEFFSYCEIWEWHIWPQDKYCGTTFQRHQCWPPPFSSPYHVVTNGNFAARAILARATRCNHWEMGKEVVDFGEALDTGVTAAVGAAKEWSTHTNTVTHKAKGPSWKTLKWIKITEAISPMCRLLLISTWSWRRIAKAKWSRICYFEGKSVSVQPEIAERQVVLYVGSAQLLARQRCLGSFSSDVRFRLGLLSETLGFHGDALFRGVWLRRWPSWERSSDGHLGRRHCEPMLFISDASRRTEALCFKWEFSNLCSWKKAL